MGYRAVAVKVTKGDLEVFESWLRSPTIPQELAVRARILTASARGEGVRALAKRLEISPNTVSVWRRRYRAEGLAGVRTRPRTGRKKTITAAKERAVVAATMRAPKAATHWSSRRLAKEVGLSFSTVQRIWRQHRLEPHRVGRFKFSTDAEFESTNQSVV